VQPLVNIQSALYASKAYVAAHGRPEGPQDFARHRFIGPVDPDNRAPFNRWLRENVPPEAITYRISEPEANGVAVRAGLGMGFLSLREAEGDADLVEILPSSPDWGSALWIVTHVDLHRTLKVQSFLAELKRAAAGWTCS
jgi:DNA-binding transcriptional LysR family regulator